MTITREKISLKGVNPWVYTISCASWTESRMRESEIKKHWYNKLPGLKKKILCISKEFPTHQTKTTERDWILRYNC